MKKFEVVTMKDIVESVNDNFRKQFLGEFKPDPRDSILYERLQQYYNDTEDCDNKSAMVFWLAFKRWAVSNEYTQDEINKAMRDLRK